jgi:hypothetical protein
VLDLAAGLVGGMILALVFFSDLRHEFSPIALPSGPALSSR